MPKEINLTRVKEQAQQTLRQILRNPDINRNIRTTAERQEINDDRKKSNL